MGAVVNCGIGPRVNAGYSKTYIPPNNLMEGEGVQDINIAGKWLKLPAVSDDTEQKTQ